MAGLDVYKRQCLHRANHRYPGCRLHLDYVEPQLQHDDALRAAVMMFKQYLQVTKPGIIFGNLISVIGGFLLASKGSICLLYTSPAHER